MVCVFEWAIGLIACHNNEDNVNPRLLNSLVKKLSYLTHTTEDILLDIGLESHNMKLKAFIRMIERARTFYTNRIIATWTFY